MCRPWSAADYAAVQDEALKKLLVLDLSGFVYVRFWGAMSNCRYKDEMSLPEVREQVESVVGEKLKFLFFAPTDVELWKDKLLLLSDGLYKVKKNSINEYQNFMECCGFFELKQVTSPVSIIEKRACDLLGDLEKWEKKL
jgi:hypothetical protein